MSSLPSAIATNISAKQSYATTYEDNRRLLKRFLGRLRHRAHVSRLQKEALHYACLYRSFSTLTRNFYDLQHPVKDRPEGEENEAIFEI